MHDVRFEAFFCFYRICASASDCVQVIYRREWLCTKCATKKWLQHVSCATRKDEERKERRRSAHIYTEREGEREKKEASDRVRNEQVKEKC
jgi:hypothetical protein